MRYTIEQRKFIVEEYLTHGRNYGPIGPLFTQKFGIPPPQKVSMMAMVTKWNEKGTVHDQIKGVSGRYADVCTPENIGIVRDEFGQNPRQTLRLASQALQLSKSSIQVTLNQNFLNTKESKHVHKMINSGDVAEKIVVEAVQDTKTAGDS